MNAIIARPRLLFGALLIGLTVFSIPGQGWLAAIAMLITCVGLGRRMLESRLGRGLGLTGTFGNLFAGLVGWWLLVTVTVALSTLRLLSTGSAASGSGVVPLTPRF